MRICQHCSTDVHSIYRFGSRKQNKGIHWCARQNSELDGGVCFLTLEKKKEQYLAKSVTGVFVGALYYPVPEKLAEEM